MQRYEKQSNRIVYVGTYNGGGNDSLYVLSMDKSTGELSAIGAYAEVEMPSFLTVDTERGRVFAVSELQDEAGKEGGEVASYAVEPETGALRYIGKQPSFGASPCHLVTDREGKRLVVANYTSGSVSLYPISEDGSIGPLADRKQHEGHSVRSDRQEAAHAHCTVLKDSRIFVADLGMDKIMIYNIQENGEKPALVLHGEVQVHAGAGPRHIAFHSELPYAYVINELDSTITAFAYSQEAGTLREIQTVSALPDGFAGESYCADIHIGVSGDYLYGSNRGHDSIAVYRIDRTNGKLTLIQHEPTGGAWPRNFAVTPDGKFVLAANQNSDSIVTLAVNENTGRLEPTGHELRIPKPVCIRFFE
ncbi:lactonase family protein [Paenibacillus tyrfis]|uniref:6-phosphogluconolactonase n=1 Tax=Paenibacillus tyrfis TaxID=1501230 RepID=A0A081PB99_9BACL|nr:lactonase family protein [Paenibacillus tyrfis]KEQ27972.1 hypothetical protein ET33_00755 [Paenibacillus tyrfis]